MWAHHIFCDVRTGQKTLWLGHDSEIIDYGDNRLLKLFVEGTPLEKVKNELLYTQMIREVGVDAPFMYGIEKVDGRNGILYEMTEGPTFLEWELRHLSALDKLSRYFAYLHREIHQHDVRTLPSLKKRMCSNIRMCKALPKREKERVLDLLKDLPDGQSVCHGDFHPSNIIISMDGPVILDWAKAARGHFLADVARTALLIEIWLPGRMPECELETVEEIRGRMAELYKEEYLDLCQLSKEDLEAWTIPVAAERISDGAPSEREQLIEMIRDMLD